MKIHAHFFEKLHSFGLLKSDDIWGMKVFKKWPMIDESSIEKRRFRGRIRNFFLNSDCATPYLSHTIREAVWRNFFYLISLLYKKFLILPLNFFFSMVPHLDSFLHPQNSLPWNFIRSKMMFFPWKNFAFVVKFFANIHGHTHDILALW